VRPLVEHRLNMFDTKALAWGEIAAEAMGLSHADIVHAAEEAARDAVMAEREAIQVGDLVRALRARKGSLVKQGMSRRDGSD